MPRSILRAEGFAVFFASVYTYHALGASWPLFFLLWLVPDISIAGYLKGNRVGAVAYNIAHNYMLALAVVGCGWWMGSAFTMSLGVILASHVSLDRALGFGLKYSRAFRDTHIQHV
jgi:hypothetical protein